MYKRQVERAKTTGILRFNSRVVVQGCGPIGLICIAVLRTMGIENITAVDGNQARLDFALKMGATKTVNFMEHKGIEELDFETRIRKRDELLTQKFSNNEQK